MRRNSDKALLLRGLTSCDSLLVLLLAVASFVALSTTLVLCIIYNDAWACGLANEGHNTYNACKTNEESENEAVWARASK